MIFLNKNVKKIYSILSIIIAIQLTFVNTTIVWAEDTIRIAKIQNFSGTVKITKSGGEQQYNAISGMSLTEGDSITTEKNSWITINIDDDKEIKIGPNSMVNISQLSGKIKAGNEQTSLSLHVGKVWSKIKRKLNMHAKYEIKVPTAVMGVRGTEFSVENTADGEINVAVLSGKVVTTRPLLQNDSNSNDTRSIYEIPITKNQQAIMNQSDTSEKDVKVEPIAPSDLSLFILGILKDYTKQDPQKIGTNIMNSIDAEITSKTLIATQADATPNSEPEKPIIRMTSLVSNVIDMPYILYEQAKSALNNQSTTPKTSPLTSVKQNLQQDQLLQVESDTIKLKLPDTVNNSSQIQIPVISIPKIQIPIPIPIPIPVQIPTPIPINNLPQIQIPKK